MSDTDFPPSDSFQGDNETVFSQGLDRRRVIKFGTVAAGAAILTPTLLTLGASPASASGNGATSYASISFTNGRSVGFQIDGPGLWVASFWVRANNDVTINTPSYGGTWTQLFDQRGTAAASDVNSRITMKSFYRWFDPSTFDYDNLNSVSLSYSNGTAAGLVRAAAGFNFPTATTATNVATSDIGSASVPSINSTALGTRFLFMNGGTKASSTFLSQAPSLYSGTGTNSSPTDGFMAVGAYLSLAKVNSGVASGSVSASWTTPPDTQASMLVAIA